MVLPDLQTGPFVRDQLERLLVPGDPKEATVRLSRLDGFLTAVAAGPELPDPEDWIEAAFAYVEGDGPVSEIDCEALAMLIVGRFAEIEAGLIAFPPQCAPLLPPSTDASPDPQEWCLGFLEGTRLAGEGWMPLFEVEDMAILIVPIAAAAATEADAPQFEMSLDSFRDLRRDAMRYIPDCVVHMSEFWRDFEETPPAEPIRRAEPKIGRNEPCPCGSGKKYKRCCGA